MSYQSSTALAAISLFTWMQITELLNIKAAEVRKLLTGQLPSERTYDLQAQMHKARLP